MTQTKPKKYDDVWTADEQKLGDAIELHIPTDEAKESLPTYEAGYLEVWNTDSGMRYYIPTRYIQTPHTEDGRTLLSLTFDEVHDNTMDRLPNSIARGHVHTEELESGDSELIEGEDS